MKFAMFSTAAAAGLFAVSAQAATFSTSYGWEDGSGTILGSFGNLVNAANVTTGNEISNDITIYSNVAPNAGTRMLTVGEDPHSSTPQAYIGYIENLQVGDTITASFYGWDSTSGASPSMRIWGHWADNADVNSYQTSASGNSTYTDGGSGGWSQVDYTWTNTDGYEALVIEARLYSSPSTATTESSYFIDDLSIQVTSDSATAQITTPGGTTVVPEPASLALLSLGTLAIVTRRRK